MAITSFKKFVGTTPPNSLHWNSSKLYIAMNVCLLPYECLHIFMAVLLDHFVSNYCPFSLNIPSNIQILEKVKNFFLNSLMTAVQIQNVCNSAYSNKQTCKVLENSCLKCRRQHL
jgi:hypothetical protein